MNNNGTRVIEWAILIATIAEVVATIAQPFIKTSARTPPPLLGGGWIAVKL